MGNRHEDDFDAILRASSRMTMTDEIEEFKSDVGDGISEDGDRRIRALIESFDKNGRSVRDEATSKNKTKITLTRVPLRKRLLVAILAASLTAVLAFVGIASRTADSARPIYELSDGTVTLTFDTSGLSLDGDTELDVFEKLSSKAEILSKEQRADGVGIVGSIGDKTFELFVKRLKKGETEVIDDAKDVIGIKIDDRFDGIAASLSDGALVLFNDGKKVYRLRLDGTLEDAVRTAIELF